MPGTQFDRVVVSSATAGAGTITPGSALSGYRSFASVPNNTWVSYTITDGSAWETGRGLWNGTTLTRNLVASSTGSLLVLSGSNETVFIDAIAADFGEMNALAHANFGGI